GRSQSTVVPHHKITRAILQLVVGSRRRRVQRLDRSRIAVRRVPKDRRLELMFVAYFERKFSSIAVDVVAELEIAQGRLRRTRSTGSAQVRRIQELRELGVDPVELRVEGAEEEQFVLEVRNKTADFSISFVVSLVPGLALQVEAAEIV